MTSHLEYSQGILEVLYNRKPGRNSLRKAYSLQVMVMVVVMVVMLVIMMVIPTVLGIIIMIGVVVLYVYQAFIMSQTLG